MMVILTVAILSGLLLPTLEYLKSANIQNLFYGVLGLGSSGVGLLFLARLPLYRQGRFFSFGTGGLSNFRRKLYWLAYGMVVGAALLLGIISLRTQ